MPHPGAYKQQQKQYVGNGQSVDYQSAGYDQGSNDYRNYVLGMRDQNFTAVDPNEDPHAEWRLLQEKGTGKQYYRHYDAAKGQYDTDLFDAGAGNDPASLLKRQAPAYTPGVYDEGEQVTLAANPYPPGTAEYQQFAQEQYQKALTARDKHYTAAQAVGTAASATRDPVTGAVTSSEGANGDATMEWRKLRNNETGNYQNRHYNAATGTYDLGLGAAYNDQGRVGGAGNRIQGQSANNSWDENADGADQRTDLQKFYDRTLNNYNEVADSTGHYSWYGDQYAKGTTTADRLTGAHRETINLDTIQDPSKPKIDDTQSHDYSQYNGAPDKGWFDDQIRTRANKSVYARTY